MNAKEIFLEMLKPDGKPERQLVQYEALNLYLGDPVNAYLRAGRHPGVTAKDLSLLRAPEMSVLEKLDPIYISYFVPWNSVFNAVFAKKHGFHDLSHEWERTQCVENYDQVDSRAYLVHAWLKYPKFGHQGATDYASRFVRYGYISREEAVELVKEHDSKLDPLCVRDFCEFCGYTETEFWKIIDSFYNRDLFEKDSTGEWVLKHPVWEG